MKRFVLCISAAVAAILVLGRHPLPAEAKMTADHVFEVKTVSAGLGVGDTIELTVHVHNPSGSAGGTGSPTSSGSSGASITGISAYMSYDSKILGFPEFIAAPYQAGGGTSSGSSGASGPSIWHAEYRGGYNGASGYLEVRPSVGAGQTQETVWATPVTVGANDLILTMRFPVIQSAVSTTVRLDNIRIYDGYTSIASAYSSMEITIKRLSLASDSAYGYEYISVPVKITENGGFRTLALSADYDERLMAFTSVNIPSHLRNQIYLTSTSVDRSGRKVTVYLTAVRDLNLTGELVYLVFHAIDQNSAAAGTAGSSAPTTELSVKLAVEDVTDSAESTFVTMETTSLATIVPPAQGSGSTNQGGTPQGGTTTPGSVTGDVNGNGKVDLLDALYVVQAYNGIMKLTSAQQTAADVNKDGSVNLVDAMLIMRYYNGSIQSFPTA